MEQDKSAPRFGAPLMPQEHGAWAMVIAPWLISAGVTGFSWRQVLLLVGMLLLYMAFAAALQYPRAHQKRRTLRPLRWAVIYLLLAVAPLYFTLYGKLEVLWIGAAAGIALPVELVFLRLGKERALLNGAVSITALTTAALVSYVVGRGRLDGQAWLIWGLSLAFFYGSLLFVKSMIRQRSQRRFYWVAVLYAVVAPAAVGVALSPLLAVGFLPATLRVFFCWGRSLKPAILGAVEGVSTVVFVVVTIIALTL